MRTQPIINAMIATFLALGTAMGEGTVQQAGQLLRELIADDVVDPETVDILESVLVAVDHSDAPETRHAEPTATFTPQQLRWLEATA